MNLGIPILDVRARVDSIWSHPQPHFSHRLGVGHGSSAHHDPPIDYSFSIEGHTYTTDPSTSVGHA